MQIIVANLSANYSGRGLTELPPAKRMIMIKDDGTVLILNDKGFKPINYMTKIDDKREEIINGERHLLFSNKKEKLEIIIHEIFDDQFIELDLNDPPIQREKTEDNLQEYISNNLSKIEKSFQFLSREFETGFGPVDILAENKETGNKVAIEVKRSATMNAVYQVLRYVDSLQNQGYDEVEPVIITVETNESFVKLAEARGVRHYLVPSNWNEEVIEEEITLF